jgi:hypothetical protein
VNGTIRSDLAKRFRVSYAIAIVGVLVFNAHDFVTIPPTLFGQDGKQVTYGVAAVLIALAVVLGLRIKCPNCGKRLDQAIGGPMALPVLFGQVNNCPYCGVSLDDPLPVNDRSQQ